MTTATPSASTAYRYAGYRASGLWTPTTLADLVPRAAARHPERELFCFEGRRVSYGEFERWTRAIAQDLVRRGVTPGDRVLVQLPNRLEALAVQVAAFRAGAVDVPVIPIYREHEMRQIVADCRPAVVCTVDALGPRDPAAELDGLLDEAGLDPVVRYLVGGGRPGWVAVPDAATAVDEPLTVTRGPADPALLLYTSGTTAAPKGALLSHRAVVAHLVNFRDALGAGEHTVTLAATPLSHLGGFVAAVVFPVFLGGRSVVMSGWRPDDAVELIEAERVTLMMGATVFVADLVERYRTRPEGHRLDTYACAGAAIAPEIVDRASEAGVRVVRAYGMTETAGVLAIAAADDPLERRRAWDGRLLRGMEMTVVDEDGALVPPGTVGRLRIRGPQLLECYTDPVVTAEQFDDDGWFSPGDVGRVDDEGWVQIVGRTKDIVNRGGEKFSTMDIELAIASAPGVRRVAVTAVPDERLGEVVGAWVVLDDDARAAGVDPLLDHVAGQRLARAKTPVEWHVVADIPVTATGKIRKHTLAGLPDLDLWSAHRTAPA
ncbi:class I adenylate-forming enzyme family protein [Pseudonocardia alni]|uniref:class I adenylate-forming enzyme family protein n=1 Tax=Pseudonocardia alni TaxID=33907 RepID=UPI001AD6BC33|nr:class I adenylate-forming enzyme family protein [Pseudonocardia alni]MBO4239403.1 AMP-binding protein [Pseudonocardia alni]